MSDATDSGPLTPGQVRWLKIAVVAMGVMIVVGIAILIGRILYLASSGPRQTSIARPAGVVDGSVALPAGATVRQLALSGDRLAVHYEGPRGAGIVIVDLATGARLSRFDLVPEAPRAENPKDGRSIIA